MRICRMVQVALCLCVATAGVVTSAAAQSNDEVFPTLQWNFSTPGARANGMGRSFIGVADDASAAVTNPAGLLNLTRPQVYGEYKNTSVDVDRLAATTSLATLVPTTNSSIVNAVSFLSVSAPVGAKFAVGFSVHRFLDYHETFTLDPRPVPNHPTPNFTFFPVDGQADFTGTAFGGSAAYRATNALSVGVTIAGNYFQGDSRATRFDFLGSGNAVVASTIVANQTTIHDTRWAMSASVGALYRVNDMVAVGVDYAKSPRFDTSENLTVNPGFRTLNVPPFGTNQPLVGVSGFPKGVAIDVPDRFGAGVAVRPNPKLLIAADVVGMWYSSLSQDTTLIFSPATLAGSDYVTDNVVELHAGAEYNVYNVHGNPIFLRGGVFTNPNHLVSFTGAPDPGTNASENAKYNLLPRTSDTRGTVGVGIALGPRAQVDAAYVFGKEFVLSSGVRF
jgi:long-chain fatty acid transport protein